MGAILTVGIFETVLKLVERLVDDLKAEHVKVAAGADAKVTFKVLP